MDEEFDNPPAVDPAAYQRSVREYCVGVLRGDIKAGRLERLAVRRQMRDLVHAGERGYRFDSSEAVFAIAFFETVLQHTTGEWAGKAFVLEPWQRFILWCVFGWVRKDDGTRRFQFAYLELARKNGKSALLAGVGLKQVKCDGEPRAEVYSCATKEAQAMLLFAEAARMAKRIEDFEDIIRIYEAQKPRIVFLDDDSLFRPLGQDSNGQDGLNPSCVLLDELHAWRKQHVETYNTMTSGSGARRQPLVMVITTAGSNRSELWAAKRAAVVRVVEEVETGVVVNDEVFGFVCAVDAEADPLRPDLDDGQFRAWVESPEFADMMRQANPNLGVSCKLRYLRTAALSARTDPTERSKFLRYNCNRVTMATEKAIRAGLWAACGPAAGPMTYEAWPRVEPRGGFDLARSDDFCAASILFPVPTGKVDTIKPKDGPERLVEVVRFEVISRAWTCEARPERLDTPQFKRWVEKGRLQVHPGDQIDFRKVTEDIADWSREHNVRSWGFDPTFAKHASQILQEEHGIEVFPCYQAAKHYNEAVRLLLRLIRDPEQFRHDGDELLAWQADNLGIRKTSRDEWGPQKAGEEDYKIDAMVALLMAIREYLYAERKPKPVFYETSELEVG